MHSDVLLNNDLLIYSGTENAKAIEELKLKKMVQPVDARTGGNWSLMTFSIDGLLKDKTVSACDLLAFW